MRAGAGDIELAGLCKSYDGATNVVDGVNLKIPDGAYCCFLGPSGCGKTTILRMIAGHEDPTAGEIVIGGENVAGMAPVERRTAMMFQSYALFPHLTVRDNIAFALKSSRMSPQEVAKSVDEVTSLVEIQAILERYPSSISGGQQQRASLARALVRRADLYLLDEPMGQLEPQLRAVLRGRIKHFIKERGLTAILVTHDQTEANALADRIAVMEGGVLQQFDTPDRIKERPANLFTGTFVGEPPMNVFEAYVATAAGRINLKLPDGLSLDYDKDAFSAPVRDQLLSRERVVIGIRPYAVRRSKEGVPARVSANQWLGDQTHIAADFAGGSLVLVEHDRTRLDRGAPINVSIDPKNLHVFDQASGKAISHGMELA